MENSRSAKLDAIFGTPLFAVLLAIGCNVLWGSAFPFIKMGYRLFAIETSDTASILCFAGVRFMLGSLLVLAGSLILEGKLPQPPCGKVLGECCALGLWQTTAQYAFYYMAVALLTGAFGGILNSTQSFLGVIFAHFLYGDADRMTPAKTLGCVLGFAGVLIGTIGNHILHCLGPAYGSGELSYQVCLDFSGICVRQSVHVLIYRAFRSMNFSSVDSSFQFHFGGVHQRRVEGASHFQRQGAFSTGSFHLLASLVDSFDRT